MREKWEFKYTPKLFEEIILNEDIKDQLRSAFEERPNMLLYGPPGVGKGCIVENFIDYHGIKDYTLKINASNENSVDDIRNKVEPFAKSASWDKMKLVYLNEADALSSGQSGAQKILRDIIEATYKNCQFIFTCNYIQYIIDEIKSRNQLYNIHTPPVKEIFNKCEYILKQEGVKYKKRSLLELVKRCYPDVRSTIVTLQQNVYNGELSEKVNLSASEGVYEEILEAMKSGDPDNVRKVLRSNTIHYPSLFEFLYNKLMDEDEVFKNDYGAILLIGEHHNENAKVDIKEINFMHMYFKFLRDGVI